jgi:hypothetical protein
VGGEISPNQIRILPGLRDLNYTNMRKGSLPLPESGDAGQLLKSNGGGLDPSWTDTAAAHVLADAATAMVANIIYGSGAAPAASTVPEGTLWIKYVP